MSRWVIVTHDKTNQRRIADHRAMLAAAFPQDGRVIRGWVRQPAGALSALSMWTTANTSSPSPTRSHRVRRCAITTRALLNTRRQGWWRRGHPERHRNAFAACPQPDYGYHQ